MITRLAESRIRLVLIKICYSDNLTLIKTNFDISNSFLVPFSTSTATTSTYRTKSSNDLVEMGLFVTQ